jgi:methylenetetrahydrofolate dehydrogenase (NADP+) / methenyltetrahydrofolate cyclohydrolase
MSPDTEAGVGARVIDGKAVAAEVRERVRGEVAEFAAESGRTPRLATVLVGDDPASQIYIRRKHEAAEAAGITPFDHRLPADVPEAELLALVARLNADEAVDGMLVQLPLPGHIDEGRVIRSVDPVKDVDGLHPLNAGQLFLGEPTFVGATPLGVMALLEEYGVPVERARAVVVGRSAIVGKPTAILLLRQHATVTICHSRTANLGLETRAADILVAAVGSPALIGADMVKPGATVIDVGVNRAEAGLRGDVDPAVADVAARITPVPGGVGPMTIAMLLRNTVLAARYRRGTLAFPRA